MKNAQVLIRILAACPCIDFGDQATIRAAKQKTKIGREYKTPFLFKCVFIYFNHRFVQVAVRNRTPRK